MYFLQGLILGLNAFQVILLVVFALRRKRSPFSAHILACLIIILAVADAITRSSLWPLGTMFVQVAVLIILHISDKYWDRVEAARWEREMQENLNTYVVQEDHINRAFDKEI